eukprot:snap_masked-scaffold_25-processed-gene-4.20-mRNA-1 protein AED:0.08 eAED:0.08 QI:0/-1/0/1/-1/1/1/0/78
MLYQTAKEVDKYLYDSRDEGLVYNKGERRKLTLVVQSDSDWASEVDNRRSITGLTIFVNGGPMVYQSKKQIFTALSTP